MRIEVYVVGSAKVALLRKILLQLRSPFELLMDRLLYKALLTALIFIVISLQFHQIRGQTLAVTSLPAALFESNGGVHKIVQGCVIQLYCSVESSTATISWTKDRDPVIIDVPHLHQRTCNDGNSTTSVLTIDNFQSGDNGIYQCLARDGRNSGNGTVVTLTAFSSTADGSLMLSIEPIYNEASFEVVSNRDNRTGVVLGSMIDGSLLACEVKRVGTGISIPTVLWTLNGKLITNSRRSVFRSSLEIVNFTLSDAGVYQCIFTDTDVESEIVTTTPFRLDTDIYTEIGGSGIPRSTISLERISPDIVYLRPPEKLVIEVKAKGRFREVQWIINGTLITDIQSHVASFSNYKEILFIEETTEANFGLYEISVRIFSPFQYVNPTELDVIVTSLVDANTMANNASVVSIFEGVPTSVTISCTSTGTPTPSIVWMLHGQPAPFIKHIITRQSEIHQIPHTSPPAFSITVGSTTSNLQIVNARYPDHDGVYTCVGTNSYKMVNTISSSGNITVQVLVTPEVEIVVSRVTGINIGTTITMYCNVSRTNPGITAYRWIHNGTNTLLGSTNTLTLMLSRMQDFGTYTCEATNAAYLMGSGNVTIEPGYFVIINEDPMDITVLSPEAAILYCLASGEPLPEIVWIKEFANGSVTIVGDFASITEITNPPNKTSILTIDPTSAQDTADYSCRVQNQQYSLTSGKAQVIVLIRTVSFIQLRVSPVESCVSWTETNHDEKRAAIMSNLLDVIQDRCNCDFSSDNIAESLFSCRSSETQVVFKAQIHYVYNSSQPEQFSADNITEVVSAWVNSGPSLNVAGVVLSVDPTCPVKTQSLTAEDCVQSLPSNDSSNNSSVVIWGPIIGTLIIIVAVLVTVILLFSCFRQRKSRSTSLSRPSSHKLELKPTVTLSDPAHQPVHEYEVIPAFQEVDNPVAEPNIAYGVIGPRSGQDS